MKFKEKSIIFNCAGSASVGIMHIPDKPLNKGLLIVVGGPQYRVGSHRQFVTLARKLVENGIAVMRFDYRGMGDNSASRISFKQAGPDIDSAISIFLKKIPELESVILWGLCDAASICLLHSNKNDKIQGLILLNPWIRTKAGENKAYLKHYYIQRFISRELWEKILKKEFDFYTSVREFLGKSFKTLYQKIIRLKSKEDENSLPQTMCSSLARFKGSVLFIISGNDLTAAEFIDTVESSKKWKMLMNSVNVTMKKIEEANHTFSTKKWKDQVSCWTLNWILRI